jgi:hypothetical protein
MTERGVSREENLLYESNHGYQSDRPMDQNKPQRFDLTRKRNPVLLKSIVAANQRLKAKLKFERVKKQ